MNERIKELAEQAGIIPGIMGLNRFTHFDPEKFAALLVGECLTQVDKVDAMLDDPKEKLGVSWVGLAIAKHFGVEE